MFFRIKNNLHGKKVLIVLILIVFVCICFLLFYKPSPPINDEQKRYNNVTVDVLMSSVTPSSATVILTDTNGKENEYNQYNWGENYKIQIKKFNYWKDLEILTTEKVVWKAISYSVDENYEIRFNINWENLYGKLKKGTYRIVKYTSNIEFYSNEFEIE